MEEDIKIVESLIEDTKKSIKENIENLSENRIINRIKAYTALEHLIKTYKELKEIEESHRKENGELRERVKELEEENERLKGKIDVYNWQEKSCRDIIDEKYIPIYLVEEKIEELNKEEQELQNSINDEEKEEYSDANISFELMDIEIRRRVLQELLEKGE